MRKRRYRSALLLLLAGVALSAVLIVVPTRENAPMLIAEIEVPEETLEGVEGGLTLGLVPLEPLLPRSVLAELTTGLRSLRGRIDDRITIRRVVLPPIIVRGDRVVYSLEVDPGVGVLQARLGSGLVPTRLGGGGELPGLRADIGGGGGRGPAPADEATVESEPPVEEPDDPVTAVPEPSGLGLAPAALVVAWLRQRRAGCADGASARRRP